MMCWRRESSHVHSVEDSWGTLNGETGLHMNETIKTPEQWQENTRKQMNN